MRIAFYSPHLCLRGTTVALYDYAFYNEKLLDNQSVVIYHKNDERNHDSTITKFRNALETVGLDDRRQLDDVLRRHGCEAMYACKSGWVDDRIAQACPTWVHVIGVHCQPHGDRYVYGSHWLSMAASLGKYPYVPYMIDLPNFTDDLRAELHIPRNALVWGRTGGMDSWNIPFVTAALPKLLERRHDLFLLFQNTPRIIEHPRVIYLPSTSDMAYKVKFINTCDAMLHARMEGESFGVACGEFSVKNRPVITYAASPETNHIEVLGDSAYLYENELDLMRIADTFSKAPHNCCAYRQFSPRKVMDRFQRVFVENKND